MISFEGYVGGDFNLEKKQICSKYEKKLAGNKN